MASTPSAARSAVGTSWPAHRRMDTCGNSGTMTACPLARASAEMCARMCRYVSRPTPTPCRNRIGGGAGLLASVGLAAVPPVVVLPVLLTPGMARTWLACGCCWGRREGVGQGVPGAAGSAPAATPGSPCPPRSRCSSVRGPFWRTTADGEGGASEPCWLLPVAELSPAGSSASTPAIACCLTPALPPLLLLLPPLLPSSAARFPLGVGALWWLRSCLDPRGGLPCSPLLAAAAAGAGTAGAGGGVENQEAVLLLPGRGRPMTWNVQPGTCPLAKPSECSTPLEAKASPSMTA
mmetsp:Transcript_25384/g.64473  ORF Transcript_25384/g.64473 Transcript_25384/m.64473 type:complete len:293 (-) Transcript_25384:753-1631(-)